MAQSYANHAHPPVPTYVASVFALVAIRERLSPPQIKQAIQQWRADHLRT